MKKEQTANDLMVEMITLLRVLVAVPLAHLAGTMTGQSHPLPDMVLYGRVHLPETNELIQGDLPGALKVIIKNNPGGSPILSTSTTLRPMGADGVRHYCLRVSRASADSLRRQDDRFALPGDPLQIFLDLDDDGVVDPGEEVAETKLGNVLVSELSRDVRYLDLNRSFVDVDRDGLPDDWERFYFQGLQSEAHDDPNLDGVSNQMALAAGLSPTANDQYLTPITMVRFSGQLMLYYRQAIRNTGNGYEIESSASLKDWRPVKNVAADDLGTWNGSRLLRIIVPQQLTEKARYYRIKVGSSEN